MGDLIEMTHGRSADCAVSSLLAGGFEAGLLLLMEIGIDEFPADEAKLSCLMSACCRLLMKQLQVLSIDLSEARCYGLLSISSKAQILVA